LLEPHFSPFDEVVAAAACEKDNSRWGVALVGAEVQKQAETDDADELEEVDVEVVGLRAIGLPEEILAGMPQLRYGTAGFAAGDGPGGEGTDLAEVWGNRCVVQI
jgi:hypothetical protein